MSSPDHDVNAKNKRLGIILTPQACRAARAALAVSQRDLAFHANVSAQTIADFERGARSPHENNLLSICSALMSKGINFIEEGGSIVGIRFL